MNLDRSSVVSSSLSVTLSRQTVGTVNPLTASQTKSFKSPVNQFFCNICFCPLMTPANIGRASFVTSCGHFYCEQCAQTSTRDQCSVESVLQRVYRSFVAFQGLMPTCKICQCSSTNLTCMDLRKVRFVRRTSPISGRLI